MRFNIVYFGALDAAAQGVFDQQVISLYIFNRKRLSVEFKLFFS